MNMFLTSFFAVKISFEKKYVAVVGGVKGCWMSSGIFEESEFETENQQK